MITIDGSLGEGGGQIVRTSLALSLVTGLPFRVDNVRARRPKPGLQRQHLTAVNAAARVGNATVDGAAVGARTFTFRPSRVEPGEYDFAVGTAGSTTLVLQTVLPPLMLAGGPSRLTFEGGTHNPHAPPFEFLDQTFLPLINRLGPRVTGRLERYGFYPPGGGRLRFDVQPATGWNRLDVTERGEVRSRRARALVVKLPTSIAERELAVVQDVLGFAESECEVAASANAVSPGNVLTIAVTSDIHTELFTGVGQRGVRAEQVAAQAAAEAMRHVDSGAPVGEHLADQLLLPLALAAGGSYVTGPPTLHTTTNIEVIRRFLDVAITVESVGDGRSRIVVGG